MENFLDFKYYLEDFSFQDEFKKINEKIQQELGIETNCQIDLEKLNSRINFENLKEKLITFMYSVFVANQVKVNKALNVKDSAVFKCHYYISEHVTIKENVVIEGPVFIGENVTIGPNSYIRPYSIILDGASVGFSSEVKESIILPKAKIASNCFVGDSVLGQKARIGSGSILANRRFDQKDICLKVNDQTVSTSSDFFGAVVGNCSRIGANCTTVPGTLIGNNCAIEPRIVVKTFVPTATRVKNRQTLEFCENRKIELKD